MTRTEARVIAKAVDRHHRRRRTFDGGYGVDYVTWALCYPRTADILNRAGFVLTGRRGNFVPASLPG
jgi:hypothetical protein